MSRAGTAALSHWGSDVRIPGWTRPLVAVALLQIAVAIAGFLFGAEPVGVSTTAVIPGFFRLLALLAFGLAGGYLVFGGRRDQRAVCLGVAYLLIATYYSDWLNLRLQAALFAPWVGLLQLLKLLEVGSFLPFFFWLFVRRFPETPLPLRQRRAMNVGTRLAWWVGMALFAVNLLRLEGVDAPLLERFQEDVPGSWYSTLMMALSLAAFLFATWRARAASGKENRRFRLFLTALVAGLLPITLQVLVEELVPAYRAFSHQPPTELRLSFVLLPLLASVPFTTAYAVAVHQVLDVRLIARRALQYALARYSALVLAAVPMGLLLGYLVIHRHQSLAELFSGTRALLLSAAAVAGTAALRNRRALLEGVDRRFFREQYDARRLLTLLTEHIRSSRDPREMADQLTGGIDRALHLETLALLVEDPALGALVDPDGHTRSLDASSALATLVAGSSDPLETELDHPRSPLRRLPEEDRHWLVDGRFRLLVPLIATDGGLIGIIALGGKRSELPFLPEDRELLATVAGSAALALELRRARGRRPAGVEVAATAFEAAGECDECGKVTLESQGACPSCGGALGTATVPYVLPGKFRFEQRVGSGGMGVVYRASDLGLGRAVAVKTLRRLSPEDAMRLRREARTAAAVSHPNLAAVYGVETWNGTPMLILEFLEGGTLRQRLDAGRLGPEETVELGIVMAAALDHLHAADILHRDIKPSNIGYTRDQVPKLMDFGIARLTFDLRPDSGDTTLGGDPGGSLPPTSLWHAAPEPQTAPGRMVGTIPYLSPEATQGLPPDAGFDLWSLVLVLWECLAGRRAFEGGKLPELLLRVQRAELPDLRELSPGCPEVLQRFFRQALHRDRNHRPRSAAELRRRLESLAAVL